ncbi:MAG: SET domain-containing protein-lysine N-methyltransferase [Nanoarchaeota archaeon]|nr:SET domain-containing protein-lysine N-methyltransferase [Nanoarchaeota archaeon]
MKNKFLEIRNSEIHNKGIFAKRNIPRGKRIIEYVGEKITKEEAEKRAEEQLEKNKKNKETGSVYIFELNNKWDIDGNFPWNPARLINHSCNPNCDIEIKKNHIWIISLRKIKKGEEISYNYGYDFDSYKEHPCKCGSENCVGYILAREQWKRLRKLKKDIKKK